MRIDFESFQSIKRVIKENHSKIIKHTDLALLYFGFCEHFISYLNAYETLFKQIYDIITLKNQIKLGFYLPEWCKDYVIQYMDHQRYHHLAKMYLALDHFCKGNPKPSSQIKFLGLGGSNYVVAVGDTVIRVVRPPKTFDPEGFKVLMSNSDSGFCPITSIVNEDRIKYITMKLDENQRETQIRVMKVKDMQNKAENE